MALSGVRREQKFGFSFYPEGIRSDSRTLVA